MESDIKVLAYEDEENVENDTRIMYTFLSLKYNVQINPHEITHN